MNSKMDFEKLYRDNYQAVYYTALQLMGDSYAAEDITQEVFITAFTRYESLRDTDSFQAWAKKIAANKCIDELRKKRPIAMEDSDLEAVAELEPEENFLPEEYVLNAEKRQTVLGIMKQVLSKKQYETVFLYYFDELSMTEIAKLQNIPEGTVLSRLSNARAKIKKGVLEHEKKHDEKLYSTAIVPLLALLFRYEAESVGIPAAMPPAVASAISSGSSAAEGAGTAAGVTAGGASAGAAAGKGISMAIIAAVTVLVAGAVLAAVLFFNRGGEQDTKSKVETEQSGVKREESKPTPEAEPTIEVTQQPSPAVTAVPTEEPILTPTPEPTSTPGAIIEGITVSFDGISIELGKTTVRDIIDDEKTDWVSDLWYREEGMLLPGTEGMYPLKSYYWLSVSQGENFDSLSEEDKQYLYGDGEEYLFDICNLSEKEVAEADGVIIGFSFTAPESDWRRSPSIEVNGLRFGNSMDEVRATMGDLSGTHSEAFDGTETWYYSDGHDCLYFHFTEDGRVNGISISYDYEGKPVERE